MRGLRDELKSECECCEHYMYDSHCPWFLKQSEKNSEIRDSKFGIRKVVSKVVFNIVDSNLTPGSDHERNFLALHEH